eukprot:CAMPEP_0115160296 /NCGR_PEP_ID=MMETSP0227-20121206/70719_1 /TAXON_ID=89957 /ORGANISM="Polarella glacialis, Strain CCMP 1383" /LENGTH=31 /DNA_ID= /DNA_START= /DNA_END= /DNA_ORIENTATION=
MDRAIAAIGVEGFAVLSPAAAAANAISPAGA